MPLTPTFTAASKDASNVLPADWQDTVNAAIAVDPAASRTALNIASVHVADFNPAADGVTDDIDEIQAAVAAAKAAKARLVFPAGTFKISGSIILDWEGAEVIGASGTVFDQKTTLITTSTTLPVIDVPADYNGIRIRDLIIFGPGRATSTGYGINLRGDLGGSSNIDFLEISGVRVDGFATGIYFRGVANSTVARTSVIECNVCVDSLGNNNSNTFINCAFMVGNGSLDAIGIRLLSGSGTSIISCDMGGPTMAMCVSSGTTNLSIIGGQWEAYGSGLELTQSTATTYVAGLGIRPFGTAGPNRWSAIVAGQNVAFYNCTLGIASTTNNASIRQNSTISRNMTVRNCGNVLADLYASGVTYNATVNVGDAPPTESQASGETAVAANHGAMWRRINVGSNDILNFGVRNAAGNFAWADLLAYHWDKTTNGAAAYVSAANTFSATQKIGGASLVNPSLNIWTSSDISSNRAGLSLATTAGAHATGSAVGDTVLQAKSGGRLCIATSTAAALQVIRATILADGKINLTAEACPTYADDAAADADSALTSGCLYRTTAGGRAVFRKP